MSQDVGVPEHAVLPVVKVKVKVRSCMLTVCLSGSCFALALEIEDCKCYVCD